MSEVRSLTEIRKLTKEEYEKLQKEKKVRKLTNEEFDACLTYQVYNDPDWEKRWEEYLREAKKISENVRKVLAESAKAAFYSGKLFRSAM